MINHYLFLLKKFLGNLLLPLPLTLLLLLGALLFMLRRKTRWFGILLVCVATGLLLISSYAPLSHRLLADFENHVPSYSQQNLPADYIVVLGNWHQSVPDQPLTSQIRPDGIVRLVEGIRIYRLNPGSRLVFTGYSATPTDAVSYPAKLRELALELGVPDDDILTFDGPRDTIEEAQLIARVFPVARLVLVTSAMHMQRALGLFRGAGLDPQPAPTEHLSKPIKSWWTFPSSKTLADTEYWVHEKLGLLWAGLMGQIKDSPTDN